MTSEKRAQKFHTDNMCFWLDEAHFSQSLHYPDLGSDTSSVWNFCARASDVISPGNQWWRSEMSALFFTLSPQVYDQQMTSLVSLGDVTANDRVQDWPSRERLGTTLVYDCKVQLLAKSVCKLGVTGKSSFFSMDQRLAILPLPNLKTIIYF